MHVLPVRDGRAKTFPNVVVHPSQEVLRHLSGGAFFRGGPDWPHFARQVYARHCWRLIPTPVDARPHPAAATVDSADGGLWCGPVSNHFGHMVADFGMRIAQSARLDPAMPLVFSLWDTAGAEAPPFFWQLIDHLGVDRGRVMLVRGPTRFARLGVVPQAERRFGGGPSRPHLRLMDELAGTPPARDPDRDTVFVSRGRWPMGRFAGETYLDRVMAAAGITVFHPEAVDLHAQLHLYRQARRLIFSEGSALHVLQLLGHVDAEIVVLARRPWARIAAASLRPRVRSLRYIRAARGVVYGLTASGRPQEPAGISVLDERRLIAGLQAVGIDIARLWDPPAYAARRDDEVAAWTAHRLASAIHPDERATIGRRLAALSLPHLIP